MMKTITVAVPPGSDDGSARDMVERSKLTFFLLLIEAIFIVLFGVFLRYNTQAMPNFPVLTIKTGNDSAGGSANHSVLTEQVYAYNLTAVAAHEVEYRNHIPYNYALYQDVHMMMFIGFGFLMTFLYRYGLSSVAYNFLLGSLCIQWAVLTDGFIRRLRKQDDYYILVNINTMIDCDFAIASALVSFGAVLGKVSLLQLAIMGLFEMALYNTNCLFVYDLLKADDPGCSMVVHTFGAYFGLTVSRIIQHDDVKTETAKKEASVYHSDIFAMIGTLFLWTLYPSFNAATAVDEGKIRGIINTYFSLAAAVMSAYATTSLVNREKFSMVHVQNSTLAGGVGVGTMAQMIIQPWGAVLIGFVSGILSVLGYEYITPFLRKRLGIYDTCGIHNLHGMPGVMAGLGSILAAGLATPEKYGDGLRKIFAEGRTPGQQAGFQCAALFTSLGTAIIGGVIAGLVLRLPFWSQPRDEEIMDDEPRWVSVVDIPSGSLLPSDKEKYCFDNVAIRPSIDSLAVSEFNKELS